MVARHGIMFIYPLMVVYHGITRGTLQGASNCFTFKVYGNNLYAGTDNSNGELYLSTDFANSFINLGDKMPTANAIYDLMFVLDYQ